jgi:hypothetical protein
MSTEPDKEIKMENNPIKLLFNLTEAAASTLKKAITDGVIIANEEKIDRRINLCFNCTAFEKEQVRCKLCGCFMKTKVRFETSRCPAGKW